MFRPLRALPTLSLLAALAAPLSAQQAWRPIRLGEAIAGSLTAVDPKIQGRGAFHVYRLEAKEGDRFIITMRSGELDAYLWVARTVSGLTELVVEDDDSGGDTDARLRFRAPATGTYAIVAQSLAADATGPYELRVEVAPPVVAAVPQALTVGQVREGTIDERSPILEDQNPAVPYQLYTYTGRGERVRVAVRSGAFDAFVRVTRVTPSGTEEEVGTDDDSGGGTDAQFTFSANGQYRIYARPLEPARTGTFTISLNEMPTVRIVSRPINLGQTVEGTIASSDPESDDGAYFHQYAVNAPAGERIRIVLRSSAFDAMVQFGRATGSAFEQLGMDDDGAGGTDSQLDVTMPRDGTYVIRVRALGRAETGAYALTVTRQQ